MDAFSGLKHKIVGGESREEKRKAGLEGEKVVHTHEEKDTIKRVWDYFSQESIQYDFIFGLRLIY